MGAAIKMKNQIVRKVIDEQGGVKTTKTHHAPLYFLCCGGRTVVDS
jgi:hypothetical protein